MTRVVITSDLHLGITSADQIAPMVAAIAAEQPDLTVLAGDIGESLALIRECLDLFTGLPGQVAALAGNHDLWSRSTQSSQDLWEQALPGAVRDAGMLWLEDTVWRRDGLAVAGSIAWYDYSAATPELLSMSEAFWVEKKRWLNNDANFIDWPWSDVAFATRCGDDLMARLATLEADETVSDLLVVTHVPLFEEQMLRQPLDPTWSMGNAYFGNLTLGRRLLHSSKLRAVVSGHTHVGRDETLAGARAIPVRVIASDYFTPRYIVYEHPGGDLRG